MTREQIETVLDSVRSWPKEDQEELVQFARDIAARRAGVYRASADELGALKDAEQSGVATAEDVEAAFRSFRRA